MTPRVNKRIDLRDNPKYSLKRGKSEISDNN